MLLNRERFTFLPCLELKERFFASLIKVKKFVTVLWHGAFKSATKLFNAAFGGDARNSLDIAG